MKKPTKADLEKARKLLQEADGSLDRAIARFDHTDEHPRKLAAMSRGAAEEYVLEALALITGGRLRP